MKALLGALALLACLAMPALSATPDPLQAAALAVGADVDIEYVESEALNAGFLPAGVYCQWMFCVPLARSTVFFIGDWSRVDFEGRLLVLYHELGHYWQRRQGRPVDEWDADLYAVDTMCRAGRDGPGAMWRVATVLARGRWGDGRGDPHGSWYERLEHARQRATACRRETDAP